ncbi:MAG: hypothetical protein P8Y27_11865 [Chromatiaceae bacterium]
MKAITTLKSATRFAGVSLLFAGALGCFFGLATAQAEGLAEKAGQQIDQTADKAGQVATDVKESAGRAAESTGEYMDDSAITAKVKWAILRDPDLKTLEFTQMGADLALFSGGKGLRGPQSSGLILGRQDLIDACAFHARASPPRAAFAPSGDLGYPAPGRGGTAEIHAGF